MSDLADEQGDVDWREAMAQLRAGNPVEIRYSSDEEFQRRAAQITKRGEKQGIPFDLVRGDGVLRIEPRRPDQEAAGAERGRRGGREERKRERAERRDTVRAERGARADDEE